MKKIFFFMVLLILSFYQIQAKYTNKISLIAGNAYPCGLLSSSLIYVSKKLDFVNHFLYNKNN